MTLKLQKLKKKINNHNHDKYIDTQKFNKLAGDVFNARLSQANLATKTDLMINYRILTEKLLQIKQNTYLLKIN